MNFQLDSLFPLCIMEIFSIFHHTFSFIIRRYLDEQGEKNSGYEVLYHNMKHGVTASKELTEYFKERSNLDEHNSKVLLKLAHKVGSSGSSGTFAPLLIILKASAERLSELHTQMVQKTAELVKSILKYADELHKKHKSVKEEESGTQDAVQQMKESTIAVQKAKDVYQSRLQEVEKLKKENGSAKEIEKAEAKLKKHQEEYRVLAEKHNPIKQEFERRMSVTCKVSDILPVQLRSWVFTCKMHLFLVRSDSKTLKKHISNKWKSSLCSTLTSFKATKIWLDRWVSLLLFLLHFSVVCCTFFCVSLTLRSEWLTIVIKSTNEKTLYIFAHVESTGSQRLQASIPRFNCW